MDEAKPEIDILANLSDDPEIPCKIENNNTTEVLEIKSNGNFYSGVIEYACEGCDHLFKSKRQVRNHKHEDGTKGRFKKSNREYRTMVYGHYVCLMDGCKFLKEPCPLENCKLKNDTTDKENEQMGKTFASRSQFWKHVEEWHSTTKNLIYNCGSCSAKFALRSMKDEHEVLRHIRPFICEYCGMQFGVKSSMKKHEYLHTGEKPYGCKYCNFVTNSTSTVLEHVKRKHDTTGNGKVYKCEKCRKDYATEFSLQCHVKEVHEKKIRFNCQICNRGFTALRFVKMHVKAVHLKMKEYACDEPMCKYRASSKGNLAKHTQSIHGKKIPLKKIKREQGHIISRPRRNDEINEGFQKVDILTSKDMETLVQNTIAEVKEDTKLDMLTAEDGNTVFQNAFDKVKKDTKLDTNAENLQRKLSCPILICPKILSSVNELKIHLEEEHALA